MKTYIYEIELSNGNKLITRHIKEVVDWVNNQYSSNECFKRITPSIMRNCIYLQKYPNVIKNFKRTDYQDFFKNDFDKRYENKNSVSNRTLNRLYNNIYNDFKLNQYEKNIKKQENYENMCEAEDDMNMWNGE